MKKIVSIFLLVLIFATLIATFFKEDEKRTELDTRELTQKPELINNSDSKNYLLSGDFSEDAEKYIADQLFARNFWITLNNTVLYYVFGQEIINDTYITEIDDNKNSFAINDSNINKEHYEDVNEVANNTNIPMFFIQVPIKTSAYLDFIPFWLDSEVDPEIEKNSQKTLESKINYEYLNKYESPNYWFENDHHLTQDANYEIYTDIINIFNNNGLNVGTPAPLNLYEIETYQNTFLGNTGKNTIMLFNNFWSDLNIYTADYIDNLKVQKYKDNEFIEMDSYYQKEEIIEKDLNIDYYTFFSNPASVIQNYDAVTDQEILIISHSFDDPLLPFLAYNFATIYSLNMNLFTVEEINKIIENTNPDIILVYGHVLKEFGNDK